MKAPLTASTGPDSTSGARVGGERPASPAARPRPLKWPSALSGVGKERFAAWSSEPSSQQQARTGDGHLAGATSIAVSIASSAPALDPVSGLSASR